MLIKKSDSDKYENTKSCTVWNYDFPNKNLGCATALISGRYPDSGRSVNLECDEIYLCISGSGIIHSDKGDFEISQGDLYFFEKNEKYWVDGTNLFVVLVNSPKWSPEQHKLVD
ncbi:MAG: hypothetical protein PF542_06400 [Nanoarchaeota archaeon]|jgi:mannose-6-phosphate isomerase-like protein (cupin superfamily)|nr:hypothetical protein [Nanoarchaeota archaeon]